MNHLLTLADAVAAHARLTPAKLAVRDSRRSLSYAQWHARTQRLANGLLGLGLAKGDRVALLAYNCAEWMEIYAGLSAAGLVAVPINFRLTAPEIAYIVQHSEARAVIAQDELCDRVDAVRAEAVAREPRERHAVARSRIDGVDCRHARGPVVDVVDAAVRVEDRLGVHAQHGVRAERTDLADQLLAQGEQLVLQGLRQIGLAHHPDVRRHEHPVEEARHQRCVR